MNFHGTKKLLLTVSHELWAQNQKLFSMGIEIMGLGIRYVAVLNNYLGYSDNHASNLSFH